MSREPTCIFDPGLVAIMKWQCDGLAVMGALIAAAGLIYYIAGRVLWTRPCLVRYVRIITVSLATYLAWLGLAFPGSLMYDLLEGARVAVMFVALTATLLLVAKLNGHKSYTLELATGAIGSFGIWVLLYYILTPYAGWLGDPPHLCWWLP